MPIYEYVCKTCEYEFEKIRSFSDSTTPVCPSCDNGDVERKLGVPAIHFKGSGWYINDSKSSGKKDTSSKDSSSGQAKDGNSESSNGETGSGEGKSKDSSDSKSNDASKTSTSETSTKKEKSTSSVKKAD